MKDDRALPRGESVGTLAREYPVRLLAIGTAGCLVESRCPLEEGTTGTLRLVVDGRACADAVRVARSQPIRGAGWGFHLGIEFLWLAQAGAGSVQRLMALLAVPQERPGTDSRNEPTGIAAWSPRGGHGGLAGLETRRSASPHGGETSDRGATPGASAAGSGPSQAGDGPLRRRQRRRAQ